MIIASCFNCIAFVLLLQHNKVLGYFLKLHLLYTKFSKRIYKNVDKAVDKCLKL